MKLRPCHQSVLVFLLFAALLASPALRAQTVSQSPSVSFVSGGACSPNGALTYNGTSFLTCTSGAWVIEPVTVGAGGTCTIAGQLQWTGSALQVCNGSSWIAPPAAAGGSNTDVQYNSGGALAGSNSFVFSSGDVGIGTATPLNLLEIGGGLLGAISGNALAVSNGSGNSVVTLGQSSLARGILGWVYNATVGSAYFDIATAGGSNPVVLQPAGGNVGIGTTVPQQVLDIRTSGANLYPNVQTSTTGLDAAWRASDGTNNTYTGLLESVGCGTGTWTVYIGGHCYLSVTNGGLVGIGTTSSSQLLSVWGSSAWSGNTALASITDSGTIGAGLSVLSTGTGGRNYAIYSSASGASIGAGNFAIYDGTAGANRLVINSSGNVGIGTSAPQYLLHVNGTSAAMFGVTGVGTGAAYSQWAGTNAELIYGIESSTGGSVTTGSSPYAGIFGTQTGTSVQFTTSNAVRMTINSSGNVGIGTTAPQTALDVSSGEVRVGDSKISCSSTTTGAIRYLSPNLQFCNGSTWQTIATAGVGANVTIFTGSGTYTVPAGVTSVSVLVVGGGGGGGADIGGGGGGGQVAYNASFTVTPGAPITVTIGGGGAGAATGGTLAGSSGTSSSFGSITAAGGGGGGGFNTVAKNGSSGGGGGSGGAGAGSGTGGEGFNGAGGSGGTGYGGGGGGAGAAASGETGGIGIANSISLSSVTYGCGGGGGVYPPSGYTVTTGGCANAGNGGDTVVGFNATANTGSGGGGGGNSAGVAYGGGNGGSGIVIVSYPEP